MTVHSGVWLYRCPERQGTYKLVLVKNDVTGVVRAQKHRFNAAGDPGALLAGDDFEGDGLDAAIAWLHERHLQLTSRGWSVALTSGLASSLELSRVTARQLSAKRIGLKRASGRAPIASAVRA